MLITCSECELPVSDKALYCPHCGNPLKANTRRTYTSKTKHRRLPNGFGQISLIKGQNLRNPYRAMVTVGKNSKGRPICKLLKPNAYFKTYNDAYEALVEYNKNPYDLDDDIRLFELYDRWSEEYFKSLKSDSSQRNIISAWNYCSAIYDMRVKDVKARHIKACMEEGYVERKGNIIKPTAGVKSRIKSMFNLMLDYALEYEIVDRNYARSFDINGDIIEEIEKNRRGHLSFKDEEMKLLWENIKYPFVDVVLIQCYMGWRPQELGLIRLADVDLYENIIVGGMKTDAGTERIVPIHPKIRLLVQKRYKEAVKLGSEYLFNCSGSTHKNSMKLTYDKYAYRFKNIIEYLGLNPDHRAHDPRKQFSTMCKKYNVNEYALKRMIGHEINDITEKVYTDRDNSWLMEEVKKIK